MEDIPVGSWAELHEQLYANSWHEELGPHGSNFAFRGRWDAADDLSTSLMKLRGDAPTLKGHLMRNFRKYAARDSVPVDSLWNWLSLGQHHGLPTQMLDWTYSPYVALHPAADAAYRYPRQPGAPDPAHQPSGYGQDTHVWVSPSCRMCNLAVGRASNDATKPPARSRTS